MAGKERKVFSLAAANAAIPLIAECTAEAVRQLDSIRKKYEVDLSTGKIVIPDHALLEIEQIFPHRLATGDLSSNSPFRRKRLCWTTSVSSRQVSRIFFGRGYGIKNLITASAFQAAETEAAMKASQLASKNVNSPHICGPVS